MTTQDQVTVIVICILFALLLAMSQRMRLLFFHSLRHPLGNSRLEYRDGRWHVTSEPPGGED